MQADLDGANADAPAIQQAFADAALAYQQHQQLRMDLEMQLMELNMYLDECTTPGP